MNLYLHCFSVVCLSLFRLLFKGFLLYYLNVFYYLFTYFRERLYELELQQSKRNKLERKIRKQISKMELLLTDGQQEELCSEFSILNQLFEEYLSCHAS